MSKISSILTLRPALMLFGSLFCLPASWAGEWSGYVAAEWRVFPESPLDPQQHDNNVSLAAQPEYYHEWQRGRDSITFAPFVRLDQHDEERSHIDISELNWLRAGDDWELRLGIRKVFWGVTESQHLVDIINQTDGVENPDGEDKLGQPMINVALIRDWGTLDLFVLPGFRERTFAGPEGRLRTQPYVDADQALYESSQQHRHIDGALRWSHFIGDWDMGLSHFYGTSRDPSLVPGSDAAGDPVLIPFYPLIHQTGLDLQATKGSWLWKLETIYRSGQGPDYYGATAGFEYTFYGLFATAADLGMVGEYLYDDRGDQAPVPFENDILLGVRLTLNDVQSTQALMGVIADADSGARSYNLEASRRLGEDWTLELELRANEAIAAGDGLYMLRNDDYFQLELAYHF